MIWALVTVWAMAGAELAFLFCRAERITGRPRALIYVFAIGFWPALVIFSRIQWLLQVIRHFLEKRYGSKIRKDEITGFKRWFLIFIHRQLIKIT